MELSKYISDTFSYITTIYNFIDRSEEWASARETELKNMKDINDLSKLTDSLKTTINGLNEMKPFLDAMEKLAVTSVRVFQNYDQVLDLPDGFDLGSVRDVIIAAQSNSPWLLIFKRDYKVFFSPKLENKEVLQKQLEQYIRMIGNMCDGWNKSFLKDFSYKKPEIHVKEDISEDAIKKMLSHTDMISKIRMNEDFRMVYLFHGRHQKFMEQFSQHHQQMLECLDELEACAVQLDSMNKGARISGVVGSSVGAFGGVLTIAGLILAPFTAGASLCLSVAGIGMGVTSGVNGLVTSATEEGVNHTQITKAKELFSKFEDDLCAIQNCLKDIINHNFLSLQEKHKIIEVVSESSKLVYNDTMGLYGAYRDWKTFRKATVAANAEMNVAEGSVAVSRAATKGMSTALRTVSGVANGIFVGIDTYFLIRDSIILHNGTETETSKMIRAQDPLWRSEIESWEKMTDSLKKAEKVSEQYLETLEKPFYPETVVTDH